MQVTNANGRKEQIPAHGTLAGRRLSSVKLYAEDINELLNMMNGHPERGGEWLTELAKRFGQLPQGGGQ